MRQRIIASGLVTDGAGLSGNGGRGHRSVKDIFTALISLSYLTNVNQKRGCRCTTLCAGWRGGRFIPSF